MLFYSTRSCADIKPSSPAKLLNSEHLNKELDKKEVMITTNRRHHLSLMGESVTAKYLALKIYSGQLIATDPSLEPIERETGFHFSDAGDCVSLNTHNSSMIRHLLCCKFVQVDEIELHTPTNTATGLSCTFPIGSLSIHEPRRDNRPSRVVSRVARTRCTWKCVSVTQAGGLQ